MMLDLGVWSCRYCGGCPDLGESCRCWIGSDPLARIAADYDTRAIVLGITRTPGETRLAFSIRVDAASGHQGTKAR